MLRTSRLVALAATAAFAAACSSNVQPGGDASVVDESVPGDAFGVESGACVASVSTGGENSASLCTDGVDNDCDGRTDCGDPACADPANNVSACQDAGTGSPARFKFGVVGDIRPPNQDQTSAYPTSIITAEMTDIENLGAQFVVSSGDYMFADTAAAANAQVQLLLTAEQHFHGHVYHAPGNHECNGYTNSNCPNGNETPNIQVFRQRLAGDQPGVYFDWTVPTPSGDAHFIATAPNAWSTAQQTWLTRALMQPAAYTFVLAHEPPTSSNGGPGSVEIESLVSARSGGVTLHLYGHTHEYRRIATNSLIVGNGGAPLSGSGSSYGFVLVEQRADGNVVVTAYDIGNPPMVVDSFVVTPDGHAAQ